jgi:hypothetical protein
MAATNGRMSGLLPDLRALFTKSNRPTSGGIKDGEFKIDKSSSSRLALFFSGRSTKPSALTRLAKDGEQDFTLKAHSPALLQALTPINASKEGP